MKLTRGELLDLVLDIEERLRQLVRTVLAEVRGDWESLIPSSIRAEVERTWPHEKASADLLERANLGQLIGIALAQWKHFSELLGDKPRFQVRANEFREWRNSLAHGKDPSTDEKVEIVVLIRQVGQQIPIVREQSGLEPGGTVAGSTVLWVDDHPEWNLHERRILRALGIDVVPALGNDEAVAIANQRLIDLVISDIDRGDGEPGDVLPSRLRSANTTGGASLRMISSRHLWKLERKNPVRDVIAPSMPCGTSSWIPRSTKAA